MMLTPSRNDTNLRAAWPRGRFEYRQNSAQKSGAVQDVNLSYEPEESSGWRVRNDWSILYLFCSLYC